MMAKILVLGFCKWRWRWRWRRPSASLHIIVFLYDTVLAAVKWNVGAHSPVRSGPETTTGIHITWATEVLSIVFVCLCVSGFISLLLLSLLNNKVAAQRRKLPDNDAIMGEFTLFLNKTILLVPTSTLPGDVASNNVWWLGHRCPGWCKHTRARRLPLNNGNGAPARKFQFSTDEGPDKMFIEIKIF